MTSAASTSEEAPATDAAFYFDLGSPQAYLAAERILHVLGGVEWVPVLVRELSGGGGAPPAAHARPPSPSDTEASRAAIERRASELGLQPLRWPEEFPFDSELAMLAATYAKSIGRAVP